VGPVEERDDDADEGADHGSEEGPPIGVHLLEVVADGLEARVLLWSRIEPVLDETGCVGGLRGLDQGPMRSRTRSDQYAAHVTGLVETRLSAAREHRDDEVLRLDRGPEEGTVLERRDADPVELPLADPAVDLVVHVCHDPRFLRGVGLGVGDPVAQRGQEERPVDADDTGVDIDDVLLRGEAVADLQTEVAGRIHVGEVELCR